MDICTRVMILDLGQNFISAHILRTNLQIFTNFIYVSILTRSSLGLLHVIFLTFVPELWPLIYAKVSFSFNILGTNGQNFTKFYIMHSYCQDLRWDCYTSFFAYLYQSYGT